MAIISLSGKKQSGKSTVGKIINIILNSPHLNNEGVLDFLKKDNISSKDWPIKMFAEKLKQIVCLLIGCTMEQLEDEEFKSSYLDESWDFYETGEWGQRGIILDANIPYDENKYRGLIKQKMTPRLLLQLLGTECGREIIHPNIWVNSLMSEYKPVGINHVGIPHTKDYIIGSKIYPNWIITDMRFPNELEAIKSRDGITIRINREYELDLDTTPGRIHIPVQHESETALDNAQFDYTINNDGTLEDLINNVREILIKEKFI